MTARTQDTLLLFADISGYTRYIKDNPYTAAHALRIVHNLLEAVLAALEPGFTLAKLEGDAAFVYADAAAFGDAESLPRALLAALAAFDTEKAQQIAANICGCQACMALDRLELKFILHSGSVLHYQVRNSIELGGLPVIVLHRLGKNSVPVPRYILWTQEISPRMQSLRPVNCYAEYYDQIGHVAVEAHLLQQPQLTPIPAGWFDKVKDYFRKELPWWKLALKGVKGKKAAFVAEAPQARQARQASQQVSQQEAEHRH